MHSYLQCAVSILVTQPSNIAGVKFPEHKYTSVTYTKKVTSHVESVNPQGNHVVFPRFSDGDKNGLVTQFLQFLQFVQEWVDLWQQPTDFRELPAAVHVWLLPGGRPAKHQTQHPGELGSLGCKAMVIFHS